MPRGIEPEDVDDEQSRQGDSDSDLEISDDSSNADEGEANGQGKRVKDSAVKSITLKGKGLKLSLPPINNISAMFRDMVSKCVGDLSEAADVLKDRLLRVGTMCSGTESPILAFQQISETMEELIGSTFNWHHVFSAEIVPEKQAYIQVNFEPPILFRDITQFIDMDHNSKA